jgi:serine/threonine protein kinase
MTSLQQCKFIKLFPDEKIKITEGSSVYSLMQACASQIEILPESFNCFRIVQKRSLLLPYRKKLPNYGKSNYPLTFRVVDFNFDLKGACLKDLSLLNYLFHQVIFDLFGDTCTFDCNLESSVLEVLTADILKLFHQCCCLNLKGAYDSYFEFHESRASLKSKLPFEKFEKSCSKVKLSSEFSCLVHIVTVYAKEIYPHLNIIKRTFNAKISNKYSGVRGKALEKKFLVEVSQKYILAKSDDKQHEDIFFLKQDQQSSEKNMHSKILQHLSFQDRSSVTLVYKIGSQSDPVVMYFKSTKELEAFVSLIDYYFYSVSPYNFLITRFHDIKIDENSVQHIPDSSFNLINRDPYVSHFMDAEDAKNGLQQVLKHTGSYSIVSKNHSFLLLYTIQDKITAKQICRREGLYQIVGNEACKTKSIKSFVAMLKPTIEGRRVDLDKYMSDSVLMDVLVFSNFRANIPPMLVNIRYPYIDCSYTHKTYNGSFEDFSGHETKCQVIEFSELMERRWFIDLYSSLLKVNKDSIVKYIGLCKIGRTPRLYAFVNFDSMMHLDKFLEQSPPAPYTSLSIIQQISSALKKLHSLKIEHGCPAPHHILIDTTSFQSALDPPQLGLNIKLTDVGLSKMMFMKEPSRNPFCIKNPFCTEDRRFELRWLPENFLMHPMPAFSVSLDR